MLSHPARRVLIVEDDQRLQKLLHTLLEHEGFGVEIASNAHQACSAIERNVPDLILQDLGLPDADGVELVHRFRENPSLDGVPIIAMSGMQSKLELARTLRAGFTDYLVKPVESSRIVEIARTYLPSPARGRGLVGMGRRVLVVDQDSIQLKLAKTHLEPLGFEVLEARSGAQALRLAKTVSPDAVISAVIMPETDGFTLCESIRREPDLAHVPILLVSALLLERHDQELAWSVGADVLVPQSNDYRGTVEALIVALGSPRHHHPVNGSNISPGISRRIFDRAERLAVLNTELLRRLTLRDIELSVLAVCAEQLMDSETRAISDDLLEQCLSSSGILKAAMFILNEGKLELSTNYGFPSHDELSSFFGSSELLTWSSDLKRVLRLDRSVDGSAATRQVLDSVSADVVVLAPLAVGDESLGVFVAVPSLAGQRH